MARRRRPRELKGLAPIRRTANARSRHRLRRAPAFSACSNAACSTLRAAIARGAAASGRIRRGAVGRAQHLPSDVDDGMLG